MSAASTPTKNGKRKAESDYVDLTEGDGTSVAVSTSSPLKKAKAADPETPPSLTRKTRTPKSRTVSAVATPKTNTSPVAKPKSQPKTPTTKRKTTVESPYLPGDDYIDYDEPHMGGFTDGIADFGSSSDHVPHWTDYIGSVPDPRAYIRARNRARAGLQQPRVRQPYIQIQSLGLLNGLYTVTAPSVVRELGVAAATEQLSLVLTLGGDDLKELWGKFELGVVSGVFWFAERPRYAAVAHRGFKWRGRHRDGRLFAGEDNKGSVQFIGGGRVKCCLELGGGKNINFDGNRSTNNTKSPISPLAMEMDWFHKYDA